jgi:hypothetical protein
MAGPTEELRGDPAFLDFLSEQLLQGQDPFLQESDFPLDLLHPQTAQLQPIHIGAGADPQVRSTVELVHAAHAGETADQSNADAAIDSGRFGRQSCFDVCLSSPNTRLCRRMLCRLHHQLVLRPATAVISREPAAAPATATSAPTPRPSLPRRRSSRRSGRPVARRSAATGSDKGWVCLHGRPGMRDRGQCSMWL